MRAVGAAESGLRWEPDLPGGSCGESLMMMSPSRSEGDRQASLDPISGLLGAGGKPELRPVLAVAVGDGDRPFQASEQGRVCARNQQKLLSLWMEVGNPPWGANTGPCIK